jgi:hypothetical protein
VSKSGIRSGSSQRARRARGVIRKAVWIGVKKEDRRNSEEYIGGFERVVKEPRLEIPKPQRKIG